jgi:FlaA1/EpsC-like NDP-sugar epimerase
VQLVVQAGAIADSGEVLVLDMGSPARVADVARRLAEGSGRDVEIVFTGLRPGEKLHEALFSKDERDVRPKHPLISHVSAPMIDVDLITGLDISTAPGPLIQALQRVSESAPLLDATEPVAARSGPGSNGHGSDHVDMGRTGEHR